MYKWTLFTWTLITFEALTNYFNISPSLLLVVTTTGFLNVRNPKTIFISKSLWLAGIAKTDIVERRIPFVILLLITGRHECLHLSNVFVAWFDIAEFKQGQKVQSRLEISDVPIEVHEIRKSTSLYYF